MKNVTVVIATTFALVSTAMAVEMVRRHSSSDVVAQNPPAAEADPTTSAAPVKLDRLPPDPRLLTGDAASSETPAAALAQDTTAAQAQPVIEPTAPESPPMRDASPLIPPASPDADKTPAEAKAPEAKPAPLAIPQAAEAAAPAPKAETAAVKPVIPTPPAKSSTKPASRKSETENARAEKPAEPKPSAGSNDKPRRLAKAHEPAQDEEHPHAERRLQRPAHYARWQGGSPVEAGAYAFSGSFGGCVYRGVVSISGYRIDRSC